MAELEEDARTRLLHLFEITKLLVTFESIEKTFDAALGIAAKSLPLRSAILVEQRERDSKMIVWPSEGQDSEMIRAAKAHAEAAFRYLVGASASEQMNIQELAGATTLPGPSTFEEESIDRKRFIVIPMSVARQTFGALQLEGAAALNEDDLIFVNTIANQLALAVDRQRAWARDIKRREEAEAINERYQALVDNLDNAFVWEADVETQQITYVSARAEKLLGHRSWYEHVHPDDRELVRATLQQALSSKTNQRCEHRCIARDGREVWLHTGVHFAEGDGDSARLQGVSVDITEAKEAEGAQRFLLQASKTLGATLDFSSLLQELTRLCIPKLGDLCIFEVVTDDGKITRAAWAHVDPEQQRRLDETSCELRDLGLGPLMRVPVVLGERALGALSFAYGGAERRHTDVQRSLTEELARRAAFALENVRLYEQAQRAIQLREQILAIVSHDLRNPLSGILLSAKTLSRMHASSAANPRMVPTIERIENAAERMHRLIEDLVDFASIQAGRLSIDLRRHDVRSILDETVASFESAALERKVRLLAETASGIPDVDCDRERILQVLSNLVGNAVKVTQDGAILVRAEARGNEVLIAVSDTGPGIAEEDLEHIFERYWRGEKTEYKGTGLGLAIARGIIEAHGGRIWAESTRGRGTIFFFTLRVSLQASHPSGDSARQ